MGEARRRKLAGNVEPNPKYRRTRKMTRKELDSITPQNMVEVMALMMAAKRRHFVKLPR